MGLGWGSFLPVEIQIKKEKTDGQLGSELRSCVKVELAILGSPSLKVSVDVKQQ